MPCRADRAARRVPIAILDLPAARSTAGKRRPCRARSLAALHPERESCPTGPSAARRGSLVLCRGAIRRPEAS